MMAFVILMFISDMTEDCPAATVSNVTLATQPLWLVFFLIFWTICSSFVAYDVWGQTSPSSCYSCSVITPAIEILFRSLVGFDSKFNIWSAFAIITIISLITPLNPWHLFCESINVVVGVPLQRVPLQKLLLLLKRDSFIKKFVKFSHKVFDTIFLN